MQIADGETGILRIVEHSGFDSGLLEYFAAVDDDHAACGRAARSGAQLVIPDVETDDGFALHREAAAASGFRAVTSTPLVDHAGLHLAGAQSLLAAGPASAHVRAALAELDLAIGEARAASLVMLLDADTGRP